MKVLNAEELAELLHEANQMLLSNEERAMMDANPQESWVECAEFNRDDYRQMAQYILTKARVGAFVKKPA